MVSITASKSPFVGNESTGQTMLQYAKHGLVQAFIALMTLNLAAILVPLSAMAESPDVGADQEATGSQDTAPESTRTNNSFDLTRPQNAFEVRPSDQTSSNDTSKTNQAQVLLRVESKIPLDVGWRLGVLAEVLSWKRRRPTLTL
jgi:hypothetical protein